MREHPTRMTKEQIATLARGIVTGEVFFTTDEDVAADSFGLIIALASAQWADSYIAEIGGFSAPMSKALSTAINGHPVFTEVRVIHVKDVKRVIKQVERWNKALNEKVH